MVLYSVGFTFAFGEISVPLIPSFWESLIFRRWLQGSLWFCPVLV